MATSNAAIWRVRVDTGGTFTDAWGCDPNGKEIRSKILSDGRLRFKVIAVRGDEVETSGSAAWQDHTLIGWKSREGSVVMASREGARFLKLSGALPEIGTVLELSCGDEAPVAAARLLTGTPAGEPLPEMDFRVATTRGTNALLERKGARTAFFVTEGFGDLLVIRDQRRKELFAIVQPEHQPLPMVTREIAGRFDKEGREIHALDEEGLVKAAREALEAGCESAAVAFLHAWKNPAHEQRAAEILRAAGFSHITLSSEAAPLIRLLPRAETAVADAYLAPVMEHFVERVRQPLGGREPWMMTSAGGLVPAGRFRPKDSLLSGPAGGMVGAAEMAKTAGFPKVLTFDMGGTSTDVARIDGPLTWRYEQEIGPARVFAPAMKIETVAAGGGSICQWRQGRLEVGPESAGADPGPACYGRGGPLTVTDVNLLLGHMDPEKAGIPLDLEAARKALRALISEMVADGEREPDEKVFLEGLRKIAVETMAEAIRSVSIREGCAVDDYALLAFGGAGPQHACAVAEKLGVKSVLIPADAGLLSAWGLEKARRQEQRVRQVLSPLAEVREDLEKWVVELGNEAKQALGLGETSQRRLLEIRLTGQDTPLSIEWISPKQDLEGAFTSAYQQLYGYPPPRGKKLEVVSLRVVVEEVTNAVAAEDFPNEGDPGPQLLQDRFSTCVIPQGWTLHRGSAETLLIRRVEEKGPKASLEMAPAVRAGLFRSRFEGIVSSMGEMLRRTALSTNVKERLDFSCALLDANGYLIASAPHVPVHLGALGVCVRECLKRLPMRAGDVVITNHPAAGGSHLPDVTLIAPVHDSDGSLIGYVANRAHHAEIGGMAPGSMPANATRLSEEGVILSPQYLIEGGVSRLDEIERQLAEAPWPSRRISDNLADLASQLAACAHGRAALIRLSEEHSAEIVRTELSGILSRSAALMQKKLAGQDWERNASTKYDDGTPLVVRLSAQSGRLRLDFSGTGPVHQRNLNATPAILRSAVLYVLRLWLAEDVPLNEGLLEAVEIKVPISILSPDFTGDPEDFPAVVGGNVETSQRVTDLLLEALDIAANGPGTMNNFLFGNEEFGYYETISGGAGASPQGNGASGRHCHMTNTAITDPEIMELRYPVRLLRFSIRVGSGGKGMFDGGDGVIRELEILAPLTVSFLTERRLDGPRGLHGGSNGSRGSQTRIMPDGSQITLPSAITFMAREGEILRIKTPGGGGWGDAAFS
jgi:5-oxoprolinase (ATP-hydrolysing)